MSDSIKRRLPGGKVVTTAAAYMDGWRKAVAPLCERTRWVVHSFLPDGVLLMSADMKEKQPISRAFIEALGIVHNSLDTGAEARNVESRHNGAGQGNT